MTDPITCPRCKRSFGGEQAYRRGHRWQGRPRKETCRRVTELRKSYTLWCDDAGVWRVRGARTPGQLRLPLFGRGRPQRARLFFVTRVGKRTVVVRTRPHTHAQIAEKAA